jgi:hypothetical protein
MFGMSIGGFEDIATEFPDLFGRAIAVRYAEIGEQLRRNVFHLAP